MAQPSTSERVRFEELFDACEGRVRAYALRRLREVQDAEDVVAETFAIAWRRIGEVPPDALPWLYATARLVLANHRRSAGRRSALVDAVVSQAAVVSDAPAESYESGVLEALAGLSAADQEALLLVAWEGLSHRQAAEAVGCSVPAFAARHRRARRRLARAIRGPEEVPHRPQPPFDEPREET
jgi:RNA polymerase sigma-70 factor (ECF subfamily)